MTTAPTPWRRLLCLAFAAAALAGCGGGGGGSGGGSQPTLTGDANAAGIWQGTFASDDGTRRGFSVIVAPSGEFAGTIESTGVNGRFLVGTGDTTLAAFTGTGTVFVQAGSALLPNGQVSDPLTMTDGNVVERSVLNGHYSGGGESGSFSLGYAPLTTRGGSLNLLGGVYSVYPPAAGQVLSVLTINGNSLTFATGSGCNGAGTVSVVDPSLNIYEWSMLISGCSGFPDYSVSGLATLSDSPRGGNDNLVVFYGATATRDTPFVFRGSK